MTGPRVRRARSAGFSLVEVMAAVVILAVVVLSVARYVAARVRQSGVTRVRGRAMAAAIQRVEQVKAAPTYAALDSMAITETSIPGEPQMARRTFVVRVGGGATDSVDFKRVTVVVSGRALAPSVVKVTAVGEF